MNALQREYFRLKLLSWREDILRETQETLRQLRDEKLNQPDMVDRASHEVERAIELRTRDRERKLIAKIDAALVRLDNGTYGFCEETGEPIALKRLEARPIATLSIEAQATAGRISKAVILDESPRIFCNHLAPRGRRSCSQSATAK